MLPSTHAPGGYVNPSPLPSYLQPEPPPHQQTAYSYPQSAQPSPVLSPHQPHQPQYYAPQQPSHHALHQPIHPPQGHHHPLHQPFLQQPPSPAPIPNANSGGGGFGDFGGAQYLQTISAASPIGGLMAHTIGAAGANVQSRLSQYHLTVDSARDLFDVNSHYVRRKLALVLFPFLPQLWEQKEAKKPDLYIPLMAFITCILILSILWGAGGNQFTPQVISQRASSGFVTMVLEACLVQLLFYLFGKRMLHILQLLAYMGYIFVPAVAILLSSVLFGPIVYWIVLVY
ncbi:MAG: hypothetical protein Q8P67_02615, partial [archaeon]|nr:hypothetical protein [archaeon]